MILIAFIFVVILLAIEIAYRPRIDISREYVILWYGIKKRKHVNIY